MKTETIEWYEPSEKMPEVGRPLTIVARGQTYYGARWDEGYDGTLRWEDNEQWGISYERDFVTLWSYAPTGEVFTGDIQA